ncbi:DEAD/DEAH box RNA helicase, putative [Eimeria necatrix]|uniref:DEAD/DEAH box RNA helicase, putative n=1 Tax=Eimeria necatrix TaxID=51315 RepID=U6N149_9EIME|nr:DEAD/DEAH box RNA helicase, putative [Eimeria necatrix]CDJ67655.1 DEAD/DEAH box RNA helicase, putative [Eimeria necatrix]
MGSRKRSTVGAPQARGAPQSSEGGKRVLAASGSDSEDDILLQKQQQQNTAAGEGELELSDGCLDEDEASTDEETPAGPGDPEGPLSADSSEDDSPRRQQKKQQKESSSKAPQSSSNVLLDVETNWADLYLSRPLLKALDALGYAHPSFVQSAAIPAALRGRDLLVNAQTGSGKTAAFLLPLLERLLQSPGVRARKMTPTGPVGGLRGSKGLVLLPTRELAMQCYQLLQDLCKFAPITSTLAVGGVTLFQQETALRLQPDIVVATPGRIIDLLLNSISIHLELLEVVVLDEADRLLELGFRDQILQVLRHCHRGRQTMLFSATLSASISSLALLALQSPLHITCEPRGSSSSSGISSSKKSQQQLPENLQQQFVELQGEEQRLPALVHLVRTAFKHRVIVFFGTKKAAHEAFLLFSLLGLSAAELHGDLTQQMRADSLAKFEEGTADILLASELASRGLDVAEVSAVINFSPPKDVERYVHSVGRTARMGRHGTAATLYNKNSSERLAIKRLLAALGARDKQQQKQKQQVLRRRIDSANLEAIDKELRGLEGALQKKRQEETLEREMRLAEIFIAKANNIQQHADEIYSRPHREWFVSAGDKRKLQEASRIDAEARALISNSSSTVSKEAAKDTKQKQKHKQQQQQDTTESDSSDAADSSSVGEEEESEEELPEWATAESVASEEEEEDLEGAEKTSLSEPKALVKVKEIKVTKEQKARLQQQQQQLQKKEKKHQTMTPRQKERMQEFRMAKAAARSVKKNARPQRLRIDTEVDEDYLGGYRRPGSRKPQKKKRRREDIERSSGNNSKVSGVDKSVGPEQKKRRRTQVGSGSFKSKKRYKRR